VGGPGIWSVTQQSPLVLAAAFVVGAPAALMALWAFSEFLRVGGGTPVPLDPPRRLVTTGV